MLSKSVECKTLILELSLIYKIQKYCQNKIIAKIMLIVFKFLLIIQLYKK